MKRSGLVKPIGECGEGWYRNRMSAKAVTEAPPDAALADHHRRVWRALDQIAADNGHSASALAKLAGLDPTSFNPSKRVTREGRLRWPSVETLAKVAEATGNGLRDVAAMLDDRPERARYLPLARLDFSKTPGEAHLSSAEQEQAPYQLEDREAFYLDLDGALPPLYRAGDRLLLSPNAALALGDRAVAALKSKDAIQPVHLGEITGVDAKKLRLRPFSGGDDISVPRKDCLWIARILAVSQ